MSVLNRPSLALCYSSPSEGTQDASKCLGIHRTGVLCHLQFRPFSEHGAELKIRPGSAAGEARTEAPPGVLQGESRLGIGHLCAWRDSHRQHWMGQGQHLELPSERRRSHLCLCYCLVLLYHVPPIPNFWDSQGKSGLCPKKLPSTNSWALGWLCFEFNSRRPLAPGPSTPTLSPWPCRLTH